MTEKRIETPNKPKVKLVGTDGNAFALLGKCRRVARENKWPSETIDAVMDEAMAGDYNNLLATLCKYFDVR